MSDTVVDFTDSQSPPVFHGRVFLSGMRISAAEEWQTDEPLELTYARLATVETSAGGKAIFIAKTPAPAISDEQLAERVRARQISERIMALERAFFEDYGKALKKESWAAFECFMKYNPSAATPLIGAEEAGVIVATWRKGAECLSLRFSDRYRLSFAVTFRSGKDLQRRWGPATLATVLSECPEARRLVMP
jgi:hypothetical protein